MSQLERWNIPRLNITAATLPLAQRISGVRTLVLILAFAAGGMLLPWLAHQVHLAGPTFLPMHIFVILAGLLYGWRAGLAVGLLTPLLSYAISGLPLLAMLPQVTVELAAYGLFAGLARGRWHWDPLRSLLTAMLAGRLALGGFFLVLYAGGGALQTPLGAVAGPGLALKTVVVQGWPGVLVQLSLLPLLMLGLERWRGHRGA